MRKTSSKQSPNLLSRSWIKSGSLGRDLRATRRSGRLLGNPGTVGVGRGPSDMHPSALQLDKEQDVVAARERAINSEEVAGDDARRLPRQELAPALARSSRRGIDPCPSEQLPDCARSDHDTDADQLALDAAAPQLGFSLARRRTSWRTSLETDGRPGRRAR
jgi:hypothetical protein